jgi:hypothetical protein
VNDLVPFGRDDGAELIEMGGIISSLPTDTLEGKLALYRAVRGSDKALDDCVGETIAVRDVVMHRVRVADKETGEMVCTTRTVLIDATGVRHSTLSQYPASNLAMYCRIFDRNPPFDPPQSFRVCKQKRRQGEGGYLQLDPVS